MRIIIIYTMALGLFVFASCRKTESLRPSGLDKDLLVVTDNPSDSLDHLIYQVYASTGVPIYYYDTLKSGESLDVFYSLTGTLSGAYCVRDTGRARLLTGVKMLRDKVIPLLTAASRPKSFYLVDSIWTNAYTTVNLYRGYKTTVIAQMDIIDVKTDAELTTLAGTIAGGEIGSYLVTNYPAELANFYKVSNSLSTYSMYNRFESPYSNPPATAGGEEFGFLTVTLYFPGTYQTPTQANDVSSYIVAIKTVAEADFRAQYAGWPLVLQKYDIMRSLLKTHNL